MSISSDIIPSSTPTRSPPSTNDLRLSSKPTEFRDLVFREEDSEAFEKSCVLITHTVTDDHDLMQPPGRKCFAGLLATALGYLTLTGISTHITKGHNPGEALENKEWVASSRFWIDRQLCHWLGMCGTFHYINQSGWVFAHAQEEIPRPIRDHSDFWTSGSEDPDSWSEQERELRTIPQYVLDHAPYVHLFSGEEFWPCDIAEHIVHTSPHINYTMIEEMETDRNLTNLDELNEYEGARYGRFIYLQSDDNVEERPRWLGGSKNIPSTPEIPTGDGMNTPWPNLADLGDFDLEQAKQQALQDHGIRVGTASGDSTPTGLGWDSPTPTNRTPSPDGKCGGNSGYTCKGSSFGQCCSIYGFCGKSEDYCGAACDPMAGSCHDHGSAPHPDFKSDLRKRNHPRDLAGTKHQPQPSGKSSAPAVLVVIPKEDGIVDAFWFFFYSYNLGNKVLNVRFGNHVGDWEHTVIRFVDGKPDTVFLSEHNFGEAYSWQAIEKYIVHEDGTKTGTWQNQTTERIAKRPVVYSGVGTHAMYATPGLHPYVIPWGLLHDQTDRGPLWDPLLNSHSYTYSLDEHKLRASTLAPKAPTNWFWFAGHWGDKYYPLSDPRQYRFAGEYHYVNGPLGPRFKNLGRKNVCQGNGPCRIKHWLGGGRARKIADGDDDLSDVEDGGLPGGNYTDGTQ